MPTVKGREAVRAYMRQLPETLRTKLLPGAARAGATVIAVEARDRSTSDLVGEAVKVQVKKGDRDRVAARIYVKGRWPTARGIWLEYGTDPHFITVDDSQRGGRGVGRINMQLRESGGDASLVIGGKFVGATVFHPGARPHPFLRPALDTKETEAVAAAQAYINARITRKGIRDGVDIPDQE